MITLYTKIGKIDSLREYCGALDSQHICDIAVKLSEENRSADILRRAGLHRNFNVDEIEYIERLLIIYASELENQISFYHLWISVALSRIMLCGNSTYQSNYLLAIRDILRFDLKMSDIIQSLENIERFYLKDMDFTKFLLSKKVIDRDLDGDELFVKKRIFLSTVSLQEKQKYGLINIKSEQFYHPFFLVFNEEEDLNRKLNKEERVNVLRKTNGIMHNSVDDLKGLSR